MGKAKNFGWAAVVYLAGIAVLYRGKFAKVDPVVFSQSKIRAKLGRAAYLGSSRLAGIRSDRAARREAYSGNL